MRSVSRQPLLRAAVVALCAALIGAGASGCETTQDKAAKQQAKSAHILRERARRQKAKKAAKAKAKHKHGKSKGAGKGESRK